jgi:hypothetical protein
MRLCVATSLDKSRVFPRVIKPLYCVWKYKFRLCALLRVTKAHHEAVPLSSSFVSFRSRRIPRPWSDSPYLASHHS